MADIISERTLQFLPFKSEPISDWIATTDLAEFLFELFNQPELELGSDLKLLTFARAERLAVIS